MSMYRGNLHQAPDVPRRWPIPKQPLSLGRFKSLLSRRNSSLSRRLAASPDPIPNLVPVNQEPNADPSTSLPVEDKNQSPLPFDRSEDELPAPSGCAENGGGGDAGGCVGAAKLKMKGTENAERKKELERRLKSLNEKKHHLVQMLKQILNAEEEMKRRIMTQSAATRSSVTFQTDASLDQGTVGRHAVPKLSVDVSLGTDAGGEPHIQLVPCASPSTSLGRTFHGSFQRNLGWSGKANLCMKSTCPYG